MNTDNKKFVLCVDDDLDDRLIILEAIKEIDPSLSVVEATNGREANKFLQQAKYKGVFPCLILLDMNMPLMDGRETLKEIKKDELLSTVPIAIFSTSSNPRDESFSREYGVDFVTKPSDYNSIVATLKEILVKCIQ